VIMWPELVQAHRDQDGQREGRPLPASTASGSFSRSSDHPLRLGTRPCLAASTSSTVPGSAKSGGRAEHRRQGCRRCPEKVADRPRRRPHTPRSRRCRRPGRQWTLPYRLPWPAGPPGTPRRPAGRSSQLCASASPPAAAAGTRSGQASASAIGSRMSGGLACAKRRPVGELDQRVQHRLRVHHHLDVVVGHVEQARAPRSPRAPCSPWWPS
jgi:hypothetical protein